MRIGCSGNILINNENEIFAGAWRAYVNQDYVDALVQSHAVPVILPPVKDKELISEQLDGLDGLVLTGGYDIDPSLYGEPLREKCGFVLPFVDHFYMNLIHEAVKKKIPILAICKGIQAVNTAFGGTLYQDLAAEREGSYKHTQSLPRYEGCHTIHIESDSFMHEVYGNSAYVNSFHHQAVKDVGNGLKVTARAEDGVVEALESTGDSFIAAVQFHPEMMAAFGRETGRKLFDAFVRKCEESK